MNERVATALRLLRELAAFGSPRAIVINFGLILLILWALPTNQLHYVPARSVWENVFGFKPYSSGMMRSLSRLLHGDLEGSLAFNRLGVVVLPVILALIGINAWRWGRSARAVEP